MLAKALSQLTGLRYGLNEFPIINSDASSILETDFNFDVAKIFIEKNW